MSGAGDRLRVLVVDDEPPARALAAEYLAAEPGVELAGEAADGFAAVKAVAELDPDLLLLDVQMPRLDGFEVLELIGPRPAGRPAVVFATAYEEHALRAFEVHAVDYLLKPFAPERLSAALERARERLARGEPGPEAGLEPADLDRPGQGRPLDRILVRAGSKVHVVAAGDLDYAEARDDAVRLVAGGRDLTKPQTLSDLEGRLDPGRFVRIHRSYLLNLDRLARVELYAKDSRVAILRDGTRLPLSRAGWTRLRELL
jgi:two-component system LytT family response regulator